MAEAAGDCGASAAMQVTATLPDTKFTAVEYPGYVRDAQKAITMLGGEHTIPSFAPNTEGLCLSMRPGQPYAHPLHADCQPARSLLLRISRSRQGTQQAVQAQVVGAVITTCQFTGLADYQYLPTDPSSALRDYTKCSADNQPERAEPTGMAQPLLCVPPFFSRQYSPFDYGWRQYTFVDPHTLQLVCADSHTLPAKPLVLSYYTTTIPTATSEDGDEPMQEDEEVVITAMDTLTTLKNKCEKCVSRLLRQRPVWSLLALSAQIPAALHPSLRPVLAQLTYKFKSGPWRGLYIRKGHDPRTEVSGARYQAVQYTLPNQWYEQWVASPAAAQTAVAPSPAAVHRFEALPTSRVTVFQLCDLQDSVIQAVTEKVASQPPPQPPLIMNNPQQQPSAPGMHQPAAASAADAEQGDAPAGTVTAPAGTAAAPAGTTADAGWTAVAGETAAGLQPPAGGTATTVITTAVGGFSQGAGHLANYHTGWFSTAQWQTLVDRVHQRMAALLQTQAGTGAGAAAAPAPARPAAAGAAAAGAAAPVRVNAGGGQAAAGVEAAAKRGRGRPRGSKGSGRGWGRGGRGSGAVSEGEGDAPPDTSPPQDTTGTAVRHPGTSASPAPMDVDAPASLQGAASGQLPSRPGTPELEREATPGPNVMGPDALQRLMVSMQLGGTSAAAGAASGASGRQQAPVPDVPGLDDDDDAYEIMDVDTVEPGPGSQASLLARIGFLGATTAAGPSTGAQALASVQSALNTGQLPGAAPEESVVSAAETEDTLDTLDTANGGAEEGEEEEDYLEGDDDDDELNYL